MYEEQINEGVALLDRIKPGWYHQVELQMLNMNSCFNCVMGQLFGEFTKATEEVGHHPPDRWEWAAQYGFALTENEEGDPADSSDYNRLSHEWVDTILRLRKERRHGV
jgi:hypothetical protein